MLDEDEDLPATIEYDEEFIGESSIKDCQTGDEHPEFQASVTDKVLTIIFKLLNRLENIVEREMRAFLYESPDQPGFP